MLSLPTHSGGRHREWRLPTGAVRNELEIVNRDAPAQFTIRTTAGPTPLNYNYTFSPVAGGTVVALHATVDLDGIAATAGPLAVRGVKRGMDANLATLRTILEAPRGA